MTVRATILAIAHLERALATYVEQSVGNISAVRVTLADTSTRVAAEIRQRQARLEEARQQTAEAERALAACRSQPDANCSGPAQAVALCVQRQAEAQRRYDNAVAAGRRMSSATAAHDATSGVFGAGITNRGGDGRQSLKDYAQHLDRFLATQVAWATHTGSARDGMAAGSGGRAAGNAPAGNVDIAQVDFDAPAGPAKISEGELAWGLQALKSVVEPAVSRGHGRDYLVSRDTREGRQGLTSYASVHDAYYGSRAITVSASGNGRYTVINGAHRLAAARDLGIQSLPMRIVGK